MCCLRNNDLYIDERHEQTCIFEEENEHPTCSVEHNVLEANRARIVRNVCSLDSMSECG